MHISSKFSHHLSALSDQSVQIESYFTKKVEEYIRDTPSISSLKFKEYSCDVSLLIFDTPNQLYHVVFSHPLKMTKKQHRIILFDIIGQWKGGGTLTLVESSYSEVVSEVVVVHEDGFQVLPERVYSSRVIPTVGNNPDDIVSSVLKYLNGSVPSLKTVKSNSLMLNAIYDECLEWGNDCDKTPVYNKNAWTFFEKTLIKYGIVSRVNSHYCFSYDVLNISPLINVAAHAFARAKKGVSPHSRIQDVKEKQDKLVEIKRFNPKASQRALSEEIGVSVGTINKWLNTVSIKNSIKQH